MVRHEGGRWDVTVKSDAVYVQRVSDSDEQLFEDLLAPDEARELAGLLTKYAGKVGESDRCDDSAKPDESDESEESDESNESDKPDESDRPKDSDESGESGDPDRSDESEDSEKSSD